MSDRCVRRLDLAPQRKLPLSVWRPWDYLVLAYWAVFFPQALRWYVERFGQPELDGDHGYAKVVATLRGDEVQRRLAIQALVWIFVGSGGAAHGVLALIVFMFNLTFSVVFSLAYGVSRGVAFGVAFSMVFGVAYSVPQEAAYSVSFLLAFVVALSSAYGMTGGVVLSVAFGVAFSLTTIVTVLTPFVLGVVITSSRSDWELPGLRWGHLLVYGIAAAAAAARLLDWLVARSHRSCHVGASRLIWIPLPLQRRLERSLERDWRAGVAELNSILRYSLQFIPAVAAAHAVLARSANDQLLERVAVLADRPTDWRLLRFCSANLTHQLFHSAIDGLFLLPDSRKDAIKERFPVELQLYVPYRSACAGFWSWHAGNLAQAAAAFDCVRDLAHGRELAGVARALWAGDEITDVEGLVAWDKQTAWLNERDGPTLRPGSLRALRVLRRVSSEAAVASRTRSLLHRSGALGRAVAELTRFDETVSELAPYPEWPQFKRLAEKWRGILIPAVTKLGKGLASAVVVNPFEGYSGLPVSGRSFVGRSDILERIENGWATRGLLPTLILYGHRRMGKTSILRNLESSAAPGTLFVYLDMQDSSWIDHTGQLLLDLAELIHRKAERAGLAAGPRPRSGDYQTVGSARQSLNALLEGLDGKMDGGRRLILAIDEFELVEDGIARGRIDTGFLPYLRAIHQRYRWLALLFGGLHTLDELGRDYRSAFYGQAQHLRVGYLGHNDAMRLITEPHPDFPLEFTPGLRERLFDLTFGQPYLLQRLCWELVNRWNEQSLVEGERTLPVLTSEHLQAVLNDDFYASADYYFDGVWSNVTQGERDLMSAMSARRGTWDCDQLAAVREQARDRFEETVMLLKRHDVVVEEESGIRFASGLMRRWVAERRRDTTAKGARL